MMDTKISSEEICSLHWDLQLSNNNQNLVICVYNINNPTCKIKESIATQFPHLVSRIGLSKTHVAKSKFHQTFTAKHQKGRRVPINLQPRVSNELERLQTEGHIEKLSSCSDEHFISPIVITVKKISR